MSQPPPPTSQQRSVSAGNYPSASSTPVTVSTAPFAPASATSTPLLGHGSLPPASPASNLLSSSPYAGGLASAAASPASTALNPGYSAYSPPAQGTAAFRRLVWEGSVPICVSVDPADLPPGSDSSVDSTFLVVPRIGYLPLIVDDVKKNLLELALELPALSSINDKDIWFEYDGQPLRWHWQIGLLYDYHTANPARTAVAYQTSSSNASGLGSLRPESSAEASSSTADMATASALQSTRLPWKIRVRLSKPPTERLHSNAGVESCKTSFMSMIKEADFVRYGSAKKVVNLRKQEQDTLWDSVVAHDYELFWSVAQKLVPNAAIVGTDSATATVTAGRSPIASRTMSLNLGGGMHEERSAPPIQRSLTTQPNESEASLAPSMASTITSTTSSDPPAGSGAATPSANNAVRSVPIRFFLPDNAPIVQEPVPPMLEDGRANTLGAVLSALFPLLFPPPPSFSSFQAASPPLAFALVQGVRMPLDAEIAWLGSALLGPDGWVAVVIGLVA